MPTPCGFQGVLLWISSARSCGPNAREHSADGALQLNLTREEPSVRAGGCAGTNRSTRWGASTGVARKHSPDSNALKSTYPYGSS